MRSFEEITQQTIRHIKTKTLELSDRVTSRPIDSYQCVIQYEQELRHVIRKKPIPICPADKVRNAGDFSVNEMAGMSLVVVRLESLQVKVFLNVCRHRGAKLVNESQGKQCKKIVCPFHGWTYSDFGKLSGLSPELGLKTQSENAYKLKEFAAYEFEGMIWVVLDEDCKTDTPAESFVFLKNDIKSLGFSLEHALPELLIKARFNWKIGIEAFLEVYHFAHAHTPYLSDLSFPNLSLRDCFLDNMRIVVPLRKPGANESILEWAQVMYFIFPSTFLLYYSDHAALISFMPISIDQTQITYVPLIPKKSLVSIEQVQTKVDFLKVIIAQDIAILENIQNGFNSGANKRFVFTRLEGALGDFHQKIDCAIENALGLKRDPK